MKALLALMLIALPAFAAESSPRLLAHLLGYIAADYPGAVENGKVVSEMEYGEMKEFSKNAVEMAAGLDPEITRSLATLQQAILNKASANEVASLARGVQTQVIQKAGIPVAPSTWPSLARAKAHYDGMCLQCHGPQGAGDGPAGAALDPKPTNFLADKMDEVSPFHAYNAIRLGVPGTSMVPFATLSDREVWDLAFYVVSLRHSGKSAAPSVPFTLTEVASLPDAKLLELAKGDAAKVSAARLHAVQGREDTGYLAFARESLAKAVTLAEARDWAGAKTVAVEAYLEGLEPIEPRIRAKDAGFLVELEEKMAGVRAAIDHRQPIETLKRRVAAADTGLAEAETLLARRDTSPWFAFSVAAGIFLREAFEAVLILVTLLGVVKAIGADRAALFIHGGWILAVLTGVVAWFLSGWVVMMSGAHRELLEGTISAFAVLVLLFFGFWLHRRTEIGRWRGFIDDLVKQAVEGKRLIALGTVAFMAVFREAFETVLFLRALLLEAGPQMEWAAGAGVAVSLVFVLISAWLLLKYSLKLPIRQLFSLSSIVMVFLALVLTGKAVHSLQEAGVLTITIVPLPLRLDVIGLYPTYESLVPQLIVVVGSVLMWVLNGRTSLKPVHE